MPVSSLAGTNMAYRELKGGASEALAIARGALGGGGAWVVGGTVRDRLLGRPTDDLDLVLEGDLRVAARALGKAAGAAAFELSEAHGAWRVVGRGWQADLTPMHGEGIEGDLRRRDFTINALGEPLVGGQLADPVGGLADLEARRVRMVAPGAFDDDPLRVLRLARVACELGFEADPDSERAARERAGGLERVAGERIFAELRRIVGADAAPAGLRLMEEVGATAVVLPELSALHGVEQTRFHHLDVHDHTLAVLDGVIELERDAAAVVGGEHARAVAALLAEPLADSMSRGEALRFGALLHDAAKPATRAVTPEGRVTFLGHDEQGARLAEAVLTRLRASERLRRHVADLTRHHLHLGFLVHERPLSPGVLYRYLRACDPVEVDVTLLSLADRLATRGDDAEPAIAVHAELARDVLAAALRWRDGGPPAPLLRGDELARELSLAPGPAIGELLEELTEAQYAGEVGDRSEALALVRELAGRRGDGGERAQPHGER
jgi:putative nucleotidyltransferase with HDIG domain